MMPANAKRKKATAHYNADRFHTICWIAFSGQMNKVYNTGTSKFQQIWAMASVGSQIVLKTTTGRYLVTAHDDAIGVDGAGKVSIGEYLTFNDKNSAIMCATMRATRG